MCFPSAFNLPSIPRPGQSIERLLSLSPSLYLCIIQHQQWREVYQTSPSAFVSRLSSFFCQKVRLFFFKLLSSFVDIIFFSIWFFRTIMKLILLWSWIFTRIRSDSRESDPVVIVIYLDLNLNLPVIRNKVWMKSQNNMLTRQQYYRWYFIIINIIIFNFLMGEVGAGGWKVDEWHLTD